MRKKNRRNAKLRGLYKRCPQAVHKLIEARAARDELSYAQAAARTFTEAPDIDSLYRESIARGE